MPTTDKVTIIEHVGKQPVRGSSGNTIAVVDHKTGMHQVYYAIHDEDGAQITGQQVAWLHPNGYLSYVIPDPPQEFKDRIEEEIKLQLSRSVTRSGSPHQSKPRTK